MPPNASVLTEVSQQKPILMVQPLPRAQSASAETHAFPPLPPIVWESWRVCKWVAGPVLTGDGHLVLESVATNGHNGDTSTNRFLVVSLILYNLILMFRLNFVISCHAQLATLACAKMRAVWWGKSSEKPWHFFLFLILVAGYQDVSRCIKYIKIDHEVCWNSMEHE